MSQRPYFPFYPGDYLADTIGMSCCEHGVYVLLLAVSWQRGPLPDDMDHLARLSANPPIETLRFVLESYWTRTEVGWLNARMEIEREKVAASFKKRSEAGKKGMISRWAGEKDNNAITMLYQCNNIQNQNQNQNQNQDTQPSAESESSAKIAPAKRVPFEEIRKLWAEHLPELPQPVKLSAARKAQIRARWNDELPDLDAWRECFGHIRESPFLMGKIDPPPGRKRFFCTLDWITKQANLLKLYEGKYDV